MRKIALCAVAFLATATASAADWAASDIITSIPEGETHHYSRYVSAAFPTTESDFGWLAMINDGGHRTITFCDNGDVYLNNPFTAFTTNSYLKGTLKGSKIEVQLPQAIYDDHGDILLANRLKYSGGTMVIDDNQLLTFYIKADGTVEMEDPAASSLANVAFLALCNQAGDFSGYGDFRVYYYPFDEESLKVVEPDGLPFDTDWMMVNTATSGQISVAFDDNGYVYVWGIYPKLREALIRGRYDAAAKTVTFPATYLGINEADDHYVYLYGVDFDADGNVTLADEIVFDYNGTDKMTARSQVVVNEGTRKVQAVEYLVDMTLKKKSASTTYAAPRNPSRLYINPYEAEVGYGAYRFDIQLMDTENNYMEPENVFYQVYMNGDLQPHVFQSPAYPMLAEPMTQFPYGFADGYDFESDGATHTVFFNEKDCYKIGVAVLHCAPDGKKYYSSIMWSDGDITDMSSVASISAEAAPVVSTVYYSLSGQRVSNPRSGLYLRIDTRADGTTSASKIAIR